MLAAVLQKSLWFGADFSGANLSRADLALIQVDDATKVKDALMIDTKVEPQYQKPQHQKPQHQKPQHQKPQHQKPQHREPS